MGLKPITIRGVEYINCKTAAFALGVRVETIYEARRFGKLETVGTKTAWAKFKKPITIRGVEYESQQDAAKAFGIHISTISSAKKRGRLEHVGLGKGNKQ